MINEKAKAAMEIRDDKILSRFLKLGEFYTCKVRYDDIADQFNLSASRVQQIVTRKIREGRK